MLAQGSLVVFVAAHREQAAMDFRMQRLYAPIHHLRHTGDLGDVGDVEAGVAQRLGGAPGRDEGNALRGEPTGEVDEPRLVADRKERAGNLPHGVGSRAVKGRPPLSRIGRFGKTARGV